MIFDNPYVRGCSSFCTIFFDDSKGFYNNFIIDLPYNIVSNNNADNSFEYLMLIYSSKKKDISNSSFS